MSFAAGGSHGPPAFLHPFQHMKRKRLIHTLAALLIVALASSLALPVAAQEQEQNKWSFEVAPYLWLANLGVETSLPQVGPGTSPNTAKFDTHFSGGLMFAAQARYGPVGVFVDFNWLRLNTESVNSSRLYSSVDLRTDYIFITPALTYALPLAGKFHAEVEAGARIWYIASDFNLSGGALPGIESSSNVTWVDALVGLNLRYDLTRHWLLLARGYVGGFANNDIEWDVFAGVGYQFTDWGMVTLGYRYLRQEYNNSSNNFTFNADAQGLLLGAVFKF
jgi:opacity protein-like surface antigen